ncbi:hypothetical protein HAX54_004386, partial [Datura stramonium]|nr:hypothetical protein [Datura stramonium]
MNKTKIEHPWPHQCSQQHDALPLATPVQPAARRTAIPVLPAVRHGSSFGTIPGVRRWPPSATVGARHPSSSTMQCAAHQGYSNGCQE